MKNNHIFLIGFMGAGKSTLGAQLAIELKREFIDLDQWIELNEQKKISEMFAENGEWFFREREKHYLTKLQGNKIIATGGGVLYFNETGEWLNQNGTVIYLQAPFQELYSRISGDLDRPLAVNNSKETLETLYLERDNMYQSIADLKVSVSQCSIEESIQKIKDGLNAIHLNTF